MERMHTWASNNTLTAHYYKSDSASIVFSAKKAQM